MVSILHSLEVYKHFTETSHLGVQILPLTRWYSFCTEVVRTMGSSLCMWSGDKYKSKYIYIVEQNCGKNL